MVHHACPGLRQRILRSGEFKTYSLFLKAVNGDTPTIEDFADVARIGQKAGWFHLRGLSCEGLNLSPERVTDRPRV